jgi:phosphate transport system substrate-binding protein
MLSRRKFLLLSGAGLACLPISCAGDPDEITLQGSGATFPAPLYKRWFLEIYRNSQFRTRINYQPIGSGAGTRQFAEGLTDFGASDSVKPKDLERIKTERPEQTNALPVPMTAGTIVLGYHVPPLSASGKTLLLTRQNLLDILFGRITDWDDKRLVTLNPELAQYSRPITWVRRSDGSGTTAAFTSHLAAVSREWKDNVGADKSVPWPVGIGAKGNDGVAAIISQTPGAMGYVEFGFAGLSKLAIAGYQNKNGEFVQPKRIIDPNNPVVSDNHQKSSEMTPDQIALTSAKLPDNFLVTIPDPAAKNAYPIVTYTWLLVLKEYRDERVARTLREMIEWCLTEGQNLSDQLDYIPLPEAVTKRILTAVRKIEPLPRDEA